MPVTLPFSHDYDGQSLPIYRFYEEMMKSREALAVVDINGNYFGVIEKDGCYLISAKDGIESRHKMFNQPLDIPEYRHIGYRKTYPKNLSVFHYPWYLLQDIKTGEVLDFERCIIQEVLVDPHVGLYKNLVNTDFDAIYFDTYTNSIAYI